MLRPAGYDCAKLQQRCAKQKRRTAGGGLLCLAAIYLPSLLPLVGVLPFWDGLRRQTAGPRRPARHQCGRGHFALALGAFVLLAAWRVPPWLVVALGVVATFVRDGVL